MAGNAREWCATTFGKNYPYQMEDEWTEAYLEQDRSRKTRGGDYSEGRKGVRGAYRYFFNFHDVRSRHFGQGLRVASRSPLPGSGS
jgi:formylglycine-generating enzyme required for sulfatase activity